MTHQIHNIVIVTSQSTRQFLYKICKHDHNFSAFNIFSSSVPFLIQT